MKKTKNLKKAFTLPEILGVIVVISLLLILIVPTILNKLVTSKEDAQNTENEFIYDATNIHIRENPEEYPPGKSGKYCIPIKDLIDEGKLVEPVKDVVTGEDLSSKSVLVTVYAAGTMEYEIKEGSECKDLATLPMIDFIADPNGSKWVKKRTVTIIYPNVEGDYEARHRIERGNWVSDSQANDGGNVKLEFTKSAKSTKIEAQLKGKQIITGKFNVVNVDSDLPVITKIEAGKWSNNDRMVGITARDKTSGLDGICFSNSSNKPALDSSCWKIFTSTGGKEATYLGELNMGTSYIFVKDKAGNISDSTGGDNIISFVDKVYVPGRYYCPSGYTSSGSGSSMTCSKVVYTDSRYQSSYYSCSQGHNEGGTCVSNWIFVRGTVWCKDGQVISHTDFQSQYDECDDSRYQENGSCAQDIDKTHYPTTYCRYIYGSPTYHPGYYYCPSGYTKVGSGSSMTCKKTVYTDRKYQEPYYTCPSGYTMFGNICYKLG